MGVNKININNNDSNYAHSIFDISEYTGKTYDTLTDALADVPDGKQKGGMTVSFISISDNSDNKYVQFRCIAQSFSTEVTQWQKQGAEVTVSQNTTTGHTDITVGGATTPVASIRDISIIEVLFSISEELKSSFVVTGKFVSFLNEEVIGISDIDKNWKIISIPIKAGIEYKFHYNTSGECSWYVTDNNYRSPQTIVSGKNGRFLVNTTILDEINKIATFVSPVDGLFNMNLDLSPEYPPRRDYIMFQKVSDTVTYNVIGIPVTVIKDISEVNEDISEVNAKISQFITLSSEIKDVDLDLTSTPTGWQPGTAPAFVGGISRNKKSGPGILSKLKTISPIPAGTRRIRIYQKQRDENGNVISIIQISTHTISSVESWSELDISELNIPIPYDAVVGLEQLSNFELNYCGPVSNDNDKQILFYQGTRESDEPALLPTFTSFCGGLTFEYDGLTLDVKNNPDFKQLEQRVDELEPKSTDWENLNVVIMGDSITWLGGDNCDGVQGWTKWFKDKANPKSCKSYARSGATMTNLATTEYNITENTGGASKDNVFYNQINRLIYNYEHNTQVAPDVLIVALGTNDFSRPKTPNAESVFTENLTSYTTAQSVTTMLSIAQAMRYGVEMLYQKFPNVQLMFLAPQQSTWSTFANRLDVGEQIEKSCHYMGIPCLRLDYDCGTWLIRENVEYYKTYDGTHTSEIGAKRNGYLIERWARTKLQYVI